MPGPDKTLSSGRLSALKDKELKVFKNEETRNNSDMSENKNGQFSFYFPFSLSLSIPLSPSPSRIGGWIIID